MTPPGDPQSELDRLLAALVEGGLSPAEQAHLAALLRDDPALQERYLDYMLVDAMLRWEQPEAAPAAEPARPRRRWVAAAATLGALAAGLFLAVALWPRSQPVEPGGPAEPTDNSVAVLLHTADAVWDEPGPPPRPGAALAPGRLRLKSGLVRLEFYCGATVILEGPADFELVSRTRAFCAAGRLRATVPPQAEGFTVGTPALDVVDRGTEFGLRVGGEAKTEVHVFQGKVELYGAGAAGHAKPQQALTTGQGVRVGPAGAADPIRSDPAAFVSAGQLEERLAAEADRRRQAWAEASDRWRQEPALRLYYTFQDAGLRGRTLADRAGQAPCNGAVVGCAWAEGRWPGRRALEFKRVSDRVRLNVPGAFDSLTLAAWVRVDGLPNQNNSLFMTDGWEPGEVHWQIGQEGTLILGVQSNPKGRGAHYHAPEAVTPDRFGEWLHLAVTYDKPAGRVTHYVDGRAVASEPVLFDVPLRVGDAEVGNWNLASHRNNCPIRFLSGRIDELMLFARPLSGAEVERLYAEGRPPS